MDKTKMLSLPYGYDQLSAIGVHSLGSRGFCDKMFGLPRSISIFFYLVLNHKDPKFSGGRPFLFFVRELFILRQGISYFTPSRMG